MTTPDPFRDNDTLIRELIERARDDQLRRLIEDIKKTGGDDFPPVQGTA